MYDYTVTITDRDELTRHRGYLCGYAGIYIIFGAAESRFADSDTRRSEALLQVSDQDDNRRVRQCSLNVRDGRALFSLRMIE